MIPILYSFRRCPYAMRARLAIAYSQQKVLLREIILKNKPIEMLRLSSKGTVPVLQLHESEVLDESLDIMIWALSKQDPDGWLVGNLNSMLALIDKNDFEFKAWLDKYKYADRFPMHTACYYREQCEFFLVHLEMQLKRNRYLYSDNISLADIAIFPFIRQFSAVDLAWFEQSPYPYLQKWLAQLLNSPLFINIMTKYPLWTKDAPAQLFPV